MRVCVKRERQADRQTMRESITKYKTRERERERERERGSGSIDN